MKYEEIPRQLLIYSYRMCLVITRVLVICISSIIHIITPIRYIAFIGDRYSEIHSARVTLASTYS